MRSEKGKEKKRKEKRRERKENKESTPFGVNLMRSQVFYRAAQGYEVRYTCEEYTGCERSAARLADSCRLDKHIPQLALCVAGHML